MAPERRRPVSRPALPRGWRRRLARLPLALFKVGLGPVFGRRVLLLHHRGRRTGLDRAVVLEVVAYDRENGSWTLASGFGPAADWYQNLRGEPKTTVQFGNRHYTVTAHFLPAAEGAEAMVRYALARPRTARRLCSLMGFEVDGTPDSFRRAGSEIPFVRLDAGPGQRLP
ncbi:nitroreductase family deazaflavin-dependent oxidoreductase [Streptomyces sp. NPDC006175]|uniref:nitroreductase family deazaflavin-dependent oxidoreductase n=1 Tax=unclassified Streptomyces TaxID=2593676 RepID=UPI0033AA40F5